MPFVVIALILGCLSLVASLDCSFGCYQHPTVVSRAISQLRPARARRQYARVRPYAVR
jgi:hypothetical protein